MKLIFATQNPNKVKEIQNQLTENIELLSLSDLGQREELEETQDTLEGNAWQKAHFVFEKFNKNCFADDTGLEVEVLNNEPGVYSARYAGSEKSFDANMDKVLNKLKGKENRKARFRTVIALSLDGKEVEFEGVCEGEIIEGKRGTEGFGYDPIFQPKGYNRTFAEMDLDEKSKISHRGIAVKKLIEFLLK
jgi:XTP/dITP diphosphohydrolase